MPAARHLALSLLLLLPGTTPLLAQHDEAGPPAVHLIATGGTIAIADRGLRLSGEALVAGLPGIHEVAGLTVEEFSNVPSEYLTVDQWRALARHINDLFRARPDLRGVVVTHGTDAMEETAYFLDLTLEDCRPVVLTGAMRPGSEPGADGPANLYAAIRLAAAPTAQRLGTVVLMNDRFYHARSVQKRHTSRTDAFDAPGVGAAGVVEADTIVHHDDPASRACDGPRFDLDRLGTLPRVDIVYGYLGDDGALLRAAVDAGAKGIVVAGLGRGGVTPGEDEAIRYALGRGVFVVRSSRTQSGRVPPDDDAVRWWTPGSGASIGAGDLTPQKARILLMLALSRTGNAREVADYFVGNR